MPPIEVENWGKIGIGAKHGTNKQSNRDEYKSLPYDYNSLKAPKHLRQKEDSGSKSAQSVGHRRDSSKNKNEFVDKSLKDSLGDNVDLASKKSEIMQVSFSCMYSEFHKPNFPDSGISDCLTCDDLLNMFPCFLARIRQSQNITK